jgi:threonine/homoserine/homoserine lactone efflux protein
MSGLCSRHLDGLAFSMMMRHEAAEAVGSINPWSEGCMDFIPSLGVLGAFAIAAVALTFTPGPDMTLFLGKAVTQSRAAGMAAMFGASTGLLVHTTLAALGLSALLAASATAFLALKIAGAVYLLWLAIEAVRHGSGLNLEVPGSAPGDPLPRIWAKGLAVNLLNPKVIMFFVTFLPQFIDANDPHASGKLLFLGLFFVAICTPLCALMVASASRLAGLLKRSPRIMRGVDWLFAGVFGAFALKLLLSQRH